MFDLSKRQFRLLVVDDEPSIRDIFSRILVRYGYITDTAETAEEALIRVLTGVRYDLILTDLSLPGMDGLTFFRQLRAHDIATPVILISGCYDSKMDEIQKALQNGLLGFYQKPVTPSTLIDIVRNAEQAMKSGEMTDGKLSEATAAYEVTSSAIPLIN
jgi:CheY-like chemotaxis protein